MRQLRLNTAIYLLLPFLSAVLMGASAYHQQNKRCERVEIELEEVEQNHFLDVGDVKSLIGADNQLVNARLGELDLQQIEERLKATRLVERAEAYVTTGEVLRLRVKLRRPLARFLPDQGHSFYLDSRYRRMPLSRHYAARTPLVTGHCTLNFPTPFGVVSVPRPGVLAVIRELQRHPHLQAQVAEIAINKHSELTLYPEFGHGVIEFGQPRNIVGKFEKLETFYRKVLKRVGWNTYQRINLQYANQIVAQR